MMTQQDRKILRKLAREQMEMAHSETNQQIIQEWRRHHRFEPGRPMIHLELGTFAQEVVAPRIQCEDEMARKMEWTLYSQFLNQKLFGDDHPVRDYYPLHHPVYFHLFDQEVGRTHVQEGDHDGIGHQFQHVIHDLKQDYHLLKQSTYGVDREAGQRYGEMVDDILGDILPTRWIGSSLGSCSTQKVVHLMGMETMFMSMYDYPDLFKEMMDRIAEDTIAFYRWMEMESLIESTADDEHLGQGSWCFTDELPGRDHDQFLLTQDVWGYMDSQETVGVRPEMFDEFIFPAYQEIASQYGLLSYGCCEPVSAFWENSLSKLKNLRKISISPWCDEEYMGNALRGKRIIYHRKPTPNLLGVAEVLDEEAFRQHIRTTLHAAQGCQLEITQRDVYTIHSNEAKARRYIQIIREEVDAHWIV